MSQQRNRVSERCSHSPVVMQQVWIWGSGSLEPAHSLPMWVRVSSAGPPCSWCWHWCFQSPGLGGLARDRAPGQASSAGLSQAGKTGLLTYHQLKMPGSSVLRGCHSVIRFPEVTAHCCILTQACTCIRTHVYMCMCTCTYMLPGLN